MRLQTGLYGRAYTSDEAVNVLEAVSDVTALDVASDPVDAALKSFDVLWIRLAPCVAVSDLPEGADLRCRVLAVPATGLDHVAVDDLAERGVEVVSLRGRGAELQHITATSDLALLLLLSSVRHLRQAVDSVMQGDWVRERFRGRDVAELRIGIVGLGRVGQNLARSLAALGGDVRYFDPNVSDDRYPRLDSLLALAEWADVLSIHVPLEPGTIGLVDAVTLEALGPAGVLINTSRGQILDEPALIRCLEEGRLGAAGLDVCTGEEHFSVAHPIAEAVQRLPNLLVTPHLGGNTTGSSRQAELIVARDVAALVGGWER